MSRHGTETYEHRRDAAHGVELTGGSVAGGIGAVGGSNKLRDEFKRDYPGRHARIQTSTFRRLNRAVANPRKAEALTHSLTEGHLHFKPIAVMTGTAIAAGGAHKYGQLQEIKIRRAQRRAAAAAAARSVQSKSAFGVEHGEPVAKYAKMVTPDVHTGHWTEPRSVNEPGAPGGPIYNKAKADEWRAQGYNVSERLHTGNGKTAYARVGRHPNETVRYGLLRRKRIRPDFTQVQYEVTKSAFGVEHELAKAMPKAREAVLLNELFKLPTGTGADLPRRLYAQARLSNYYQHASRAAGAEKNARLVHSNKRALRSVSSYNRKRGPLP